MVNNVIQVLGYFVEGTYQIGEGEKVPFYFEGGFWGG